MVRRITNEILGSKGLTKFIGLNFLSDEKFQQDFCNKV